MSFLFWFRIILCMYIGGYAGEAMRHAFMETDASLRAAVQDLAILVPLMFVYFYTRCAFPDKEEPLASVKNEQE